MYYSEINDYCLENLDKMFFKNKFQNIINPNNITYDIMLD